LQLVTFETIQVFNNLGQADNAGKLRYKWRDKATSGLFREPVDDDAVDFQPPVADVIQCGSGAWRPA